MGLIVFARIPARYAPTMSNQLHVVLGAGQIGTLVANRLLAQGHRVRQIRRGAAGLPGVEVRSGSLADPAFAREAMAGAAVAYHCVNPAYDRWNAELLPLTDGILAGAASAGARLVVLDNLYMYGKADQHAMDEETPVRPSSKKGELRAEAARRLLDAHARGDLPVVLGRASDFYGPGVHNAHVGERYFQKIFAGKAAECMGDPLAPHSYSYTPDVADALVRLGAAETHALGRVWMLPCAEPVSPRELTRRFGEALGIDARISRVPGALLTVLGWFSPVMREVAEMTYQWESPYRVLDARWRARFGTLPTPLEQGVPVTAAWARATWGAKQAG